MNVALIGYGYWGQKVYKTLKNFTSITSISVVDPNIINCPAELKIKSLQEVLLDKSISNVLIVTPEETHFEIVKKCLENKKNVFVEKPLCLITEEARELHRLAQKNNLKIYVDYVFLYDQFIKKIKNIIQKDILGNLLKIESTRHSININKPNVSVFDDLATHDIYLGEYFFRKKVSGVKVTKKTILSKQVRQATAIFYFGKKTLSANYSWINPTAQRTMRFIGTRATLIWNKNEENLLIYKNEKLVEKIKVTTTTSPLELSISKFLFKKISYNYISDVNTLQKLNFS